MGLEGRGLKICSRQESVVNASDRTGPSRGRDGDRLSREFRRHLSKGTRGRGQDLFLYGEVPRRRHCESGH